MLKRAGIAAFTALSLMLGLGGVQDAKAGILEEVKARGVMRCGVNEYGPALTAMNENGQWAGFYTDFCRAFAAAALGDARAVDFVSVSSLDRFNALQQKAIDVLSEASTWTSDRDMNGLAFPAIFMMDGQGFLVRRESGISGLDQLKNRRICVVSHATSVGGLNRVNAARGLSFKVQEYSSIQGSFAAFFNMQPDFRTPPLFLYLTLLISRCGVSVEAAAFILQNLCTVTLLLFSLAVVRLFFRNNLYAFMTAAVVAFHPTLFDLSFVLGRELLYLALLAAFTYCILVYLRNGGLAASTLAGGATALCMLTRYEGVELTILALSFFPTVWLTRLRPGRSALAAALLFYAGLIAAFLVCGVLIGFLPVLPELAMNSIQSIFTEHYVHAVFN